MTRYMTDKHNEVTTMRTDATQSGAEATPASTAYPNVGMIGYYILAHVPDMKSFIPRRDQTGNGKMKTGKWIICMPKLYRYEGWLFEVHSYCGPWPLKKDLELRKKAGRKFFKMYERFKKEKNKARFEA